MTELYITALEVQRLCKGQGWSFCIIGGVAVQRWGEPRLTRDGDLTLLKLQEQPDKLERLEQKIREHARPFTTLPPPGRKS